ncbi:sensor histidine kinase [Pseudomonas asplenii]|uniref:histidine kinase n=1 Tax=Pseudomonas asplenii TaxID=53407 RepID=A0A1H6N4D6_9PSED|nr:HAMP domain-containing sensor histidine kinase [Pseudomonas fuscovaginae]SEI09514.1 Sensor protein PilS [Pseudomonas fuscovaginae]
MTAETFSLGGAQAQRLLRLYNLYRLSIGITLVLLISSKMDDKLLELTDGELFRTGSWIYLILNILVGVLLENPKRQAQVFGLALADAVMLSGLFYAAGGTPSGLGNLLIASVAISNVLLRGRMGLLIAAISAIGIIYLTFYLSFSRPAAANYYVQAGLLGVLCFAASFLVQGLTRLLDVSETLAEQRASDVTKLEELNALILQRMHTGILVLDAEYRVQLANQSVLTLLGQEHLHGRLIETYSPQLIAGLQLWQSNPTLRPKSLKVVGSSTVLQPSFIALQRGEQQETLIFLEDQSKITQQAQQLKLVALGRLTAGIAHEIRNPLGAISHAAQLLLESEELHGPDRRLTQIIQDQSKRMNLVIENVLQLSRRGQAELQLLDLSPWLQAFVRDWRERARPNQQLHLRIENDWLKTHADPQQLTQVLNNLLENGLRYSAQLHEQAEVWLTLSRDQKNDLPTLEVLDNGPGVAPEQLQHLFEPFFTTESQGTGLGLYLSRELCESNRARLDYSRRQGGSCFRITFAHVHKQS